MSWFSGPSTSSIATAAIYVRTECPECGSPLIVPGLYGELACKACRSRVPVGREFWSGLFFRLHCAFPGKSPVSLALAGAMSSELPIYARFVAEHPRCIQCSGPLRIDLRPIGTAGPTPCSACPSTTPSFPAPEGLRSEFPDLQQFFQPVQPPPAPALTRPVGFTCPECGGKLKLTEETPRLVDCQYCNHTLFLPPELWHAMHPIQKRTPWWVAFLR
ncbi:MAG: hypothetical protein QM820_22630 [Minicystis sp.]